MPGIDLKLLKSDVAKRQALRPPKRGPGGRRLTGAMAVVRENLPALKAMKTGETTWADIAGGLASQGVTQGEDGLPLTGKRLISLIAAVEKQDASRAEKQKLREKRQDAPRTPRSEPFVPRARLAPELTRPRLSGIADFLATEEDIRQTNFDKHANLFKKE
jgi:hypothetical protein